MDKIRDISIREAVLHVLDNNSDEPILNNYTLELNEEVYKFILSHTEKVLKDDELKYGLFKSDKTAVRSLSQEYLNGYIEILETSKCIAQELFDIMKANISIPSCDLMVVSLSTEYGPMLAILRLDFIKHFTHKIDIKDNNVGINLAAITAGLPANKKISKAAFIKPVKDGQIYDLLVMDKGYIKDSEVYGSNYFVDNFLGCKLIENDRDKTRTFLSAVETWTRSNLREDAARAEKVRTHIKNVLKENNEVNIYDLGKDILPFDQEGQKDFIAYMQINELENFPVDKEYLEKKLSKIKIKVSSDIDLSITDDAYKDINKFEVRDNGDGSITMLIKNIQNYVEK